MITNINGLNMQAIAVENKIKEGVLLPLELQNNLKWSTTSLGGLFLEYWSNGHKRNVYNENSKVALRIHISVEDNFGICKGEFGTINVMRKRGLKMIGVKKDTTISKLIIKLNKWILENKELMVNLIEA
ncbi:hypothetical protein [Clostridium tagluense]|uniref:Uncharacterized protein n=1 Tax=Clostridium tagluense TaxID=360422 RepID=A0A401USW3_9CLOT|nr:hypothetical protein [Clostridium tagluense]GCD12627.1 hypothetical protein Ctaglu_42500 [Clostridium tagluense]